MKRRSTPAKEAVMSVLAAGAKAMSQDAIEQKLDIAVDKVTIYRILTRFCEDGLVHKIVADDGKQYFALCTSCEDKKRLPDHHFHFRCTSCHTIECLPAQVHFSIPKGYHVERLNAVLIGLCKDCSGV